MKGQEVEGIVFHGNNFLREMVKLFESPGGTHKGQSFLALKKCMLLDLTALPVSHLHNELRTLVTRNDFL